MTTPYQFGTSETVSQLKKLTMMILGEGEVEAENHPIDQWDNFKTLMTVK